LRHGDEVVLNPGSTAATASSAVRGALPVRLLPDPRGAPPRHVRQYVVVRRRTPPEAARPLLGRGGGVSADLLTAWRMLVTKARVRPGDAADHRHRGGVGRPPPDRPAPGMTVFVTSGSPEKLAARRRLARRGHRPRPDRLLAEIRKLTGKRGVDVVLDSVGKALEAVDRFRARGGRLLTCGPPPVPTRRPTWRASSGTS